MRLSRLLLVAIGLGASVPAVQAQGQRVALPDTPAGRLLGLWLDAFNSRDSVKMDAFVRQYMPEIYDRAPAAFARLMRTNALEVASIAQSQPQHIDAILRGKNDPSGVPPNLHAVFDVPDVAHPTMAKFILATPPPAPCASYTDTPPTAASGANPKDVASMDAIVAALYESISGGACQHRDWDRFRSLFVAGARLIPTVRAPDGKFTTRVQAPDEYVTAVRNGMETNGFFEHETSRTVETFGSISQVFSTYESRRHADDEKPFARGINSIQLLNDGTRWWVVTVYWQAERPDNPIPAAYLKKP